MMRIPSLDDFEEDFVDEIVPPPIAPFIEDSTAQRPPPSQAVPTSRLPLRNVVRGLQPNWQFNTGMQPPADYLIPSHDAFFMRAGMTYPSIKVRVDEGTFCPPKQCPHHPFPNAVVIVPVSPKDGMDYRVAACVELADDERILLRNTDVHIVCHSLGKLQKGKRRYIQDHEDAGKVMAHAHNLLSTVTPIRGLNEGRSFLVETTFNLECFRDPRGLFMGKLTRKNCVRMELITVTKVAQFGRVGIHKRFVWSILIKKDSRRTEPHYVDNPRKTVVMHRGRVDNVF